MCYSGTCPYERIDGECGLKHNEVCPTAYQLYPKSIKGLWFYFLAKKQDFSRSLRVMKWRLKRIFHD